MFVYSFGVWLRTHIFASGALLSKWQLLVAAIPVGFIICFLYARSEIPLLRALPYNEMFFEVALALSFAFMLGMLSREALERLIGVRRLAGAPPEMPALQPHRGKSAVRNEIRNRSRIREQVQDSIVFLRRISRRRDGSGGEQIETATGFIVSAQGHLITTAHLLSEPDEGMEVHYYASPGPKESSRWDVEPIKQEVGLDVALLKIQAPRTWKPLRVAASTEVPDEANLITLGFPMGGNLASAPGSLSNRWARGDKFQTTLPINYGNSGGPVFASDSMDARVIGVAAGGYDQAQGITFVIPSNHLTGLLLMAGVNIFTDEPADTSSNSH